MKSHKINLLFFAMTLVPPATMMAGSESRCPGTLGAPGRTKFIKLNLYCFKNYGLNVSVTIIPGLPVPTSRRAPGQGKEGENMYSTEHPVRRTELDKSFKQYSQMQTVNADVHKVQAISGPSPILCP